MKQEKFGLAINCIDGRAQIPVADWMKFNCHVHYVDVITEPGIIQHLSDAKSPFIPSIRLQDRTLDKSSPDGSCGGCRAF